MNHYEIHRGVVPGKSLTTAQKTSPWFREEPIVMGRVLRARMGPMKITAEQYKTHEKELIKLEKAGSILIKRPAKEAAQALLSEATELTEALKAKIEKTLGSTEPVDMKQEEKVAEKVVELQKQEQPLTAPKKHKKDGNK